MVSTSMLSLNMPWRTASEFPNNNDLHEVIHLLLDVDPLRPSRQSLSPFCCVTCSRVLGLPSLWMACLVYGHWSDHEGYWEDTTKVVDRLYQQGFWVRSRGRTRTRGRGAVQVPHGVISQHSSALSRRDMRFNRRVEQWGQPVKGG